MRSAGGAPGLPINEAETFLLLCGAPLNEVADVVENTSRDSSPSDRLWNQHST